MIEVDHTKEPEPEPATPILASQLLDLEEKQRRRFTGNGGTEKLKTGCAEIDELLGGDGIERGIVLGISADGTIGSLISLNILVTALLAQQSSPRSKARTKAVVVDTTGSFPLSLLAKILKHRILEEHTAAVTRSIETGNFTDTVKVHDSDSAVQNEVKRCLEMVALSRVFDIEGLWEVLGEVGRETDEIRVTSQESPSNAQRDGSRNSDEQSPEKTAEVADSEEETTPIEEEPPAYQKPTIQREKSNGDEGTEIIIVDNMTHIINELFARKAKADAHTLLTLLSQTLHTQSQTHNILTIIQNTLTPITTKPHYAAQPQQQQAQVLFPSNPLKPSLGLLFTQFPLLHISLSSLPTSLSDAENLYGNTNPDSPSNPSSESKINYTTILQILKDETPSLGIDSQRRFASREGKWCAVDFLTDATGVDIGFRGVFTEKKRENGKAAVVESRAGFDVGNVAKVFGFGGRRV